MATKTITLGELENGMRIWNQGHLFEVRNLRKIDSRTCMNGLVYGGKMSANDELLSKAENHTVVRYEGHCVNAGDDVKGTVYDGGVYGGFSWVSACIEVSPMVTEQESPKVTQVESLKVSTIGEWLDSKGFVNVGDGDGICKETFARVSEVETNQFKCGADTVRVFFYQDNEAARFTPALVVDDNADYRLVWSS